MTAPGLVTPRKSRGGIVRWTVLGTLGCMIVSVSVSALLFADFGTEVLLRALFGAMLLPVLLGTPLLLFLTTRLHGMAMANLRLNRMARTDGLTACLTRAAFIDKAEPLIARAGRAGGTGALLMIDADRFKAINDRFGHDRGDEALRTIVRAIRAVVRSRDLVGRMGGEEFAVYLPDADAVTARRVAERIRRAVRLAHFAPEDARFGLSVSIGIARVTGRTRFIELFRTADQRLYAAKRAGRDRIDGGEEPRAAA